MQNITKCEREEEQICLEEELGNGAEDITVNLFAKC